MRKEQLVAHRTQVLTTKIDQNIDTFINQSRLEAALQHAFSAGV